MSILIEMLGEEKLSNWNLYWVMSDSEDDCFVVAKTSRSAKSVEFHTCGLDWSELRAEKIMQIPRDIELQYWQYVKASGNKEHGWPSYARRNLLNLLKTEFRVLDGIEHMRLNDVVYEVGDDGFVRVRDIGERASLAAASLASDLRETGILVQLPSVVHVPLLMEIGAAVVNCQRVEWQMAHSVILGIADARKRGNETVGQLINAWKRKTLGNMLRCIERSYDIQPIVHECLRSFVSMRNELIHSITTQERYDIENEWGRKELQAFLAMFRIFAAVTLAVFESTVLASYDFLQLHMHETELSSVAPPELGEDDIARTWRFHAYFSPKPGEVAW